MSCYCIHPHILHRLHTNAYFTLYIPDGRCLPFQSARIEDEDYGYGSNSWTYHHFRSGESLPLKADRWYRTPPEEEIDGQDCSKSGIRCQIWERARARSLMTHCMGGKTTPGPILNHSHSQLSSLLFRF